MTKYDELEKAIYKACKSGKDCFVINTLQRVKCNGIVEEIDRSEEYARLFTSDPESFYSFDVYDSAFGDVMSVRFNRKGKYIKSLYAVWLEKEIQHKKRKELKNAELEKDKELYAEMTLFDIPENDLIELVQNYKETVLIFKFRKVNNLSFKQMRMRVRDYLYEIHRP